jgi:hypothetical protein
MSINYHFIGFLKKILIFVVAISSLNRPDIGFIFIFLILLVNLIISIYTRPYIRIIYSIFKIITDLVFVVLTLFLILITFHYKNLLEISIIN